MRLLEVYHMFVALTVRLYLADSLSVMCFNTSLNISFLRINGFIVVP